MKREREIGIEKENEKEEEGREEKDEDEIVRMVIEREVEVNYE